MDSPGKRDPISAARATTPSECFPSTAPEKREQARELGSPRSFLSTTQCLLSERQGCPSAGAPCAIITIWQQLPEVVRKAQRISRFFREGGDEISIRRLRTRLRDARASAARQAGPHLSEGVPASRAASSGTPESG